MDNGFTTKQWKRGRRRLSITRNKIVLWKKCDLNDFKSNPNQITRFQNQIIILQIKSLCVIQSWFKSNKDLDLPITDNLDS